MGQDQVGMLTKPCHAMMNSTLHPSGGQSPSSQHPSPSSTPCLPKFLPRIAPLSTARARRLCLR